MAVRYFNSLLVPQTIYCAKVESIVTILRTQGVYYLVLTQTGKIYNKMCCLHWEDRNSWFCPFIFVLCIQSTTKDFFRVSESPSRVS